MISQHMFRFTVLGLGFIAFQSVSAGAAPTPVPGGANAVKAVTAKLGETVFNGNLRITVTGLRDATDAEVAEFRPNADQKVMAFSALLRNGTTSNFIDLVRYTLADKDDVAVAIGDYNVHPANLNIQQGAAARQTALFAVDKAFVPVKLIVQCATCGAKTAFRAVRFAIPPS